MVVFLPLTFSYFWLNGSLYQYAPLVLYDSYVFNYYNIFFSSDINNELMSSCGINHSLIPTQMLGDSARKIERTDFNTSNSVPFKGSFLCTLRHWRHHLHVYYLKLSNLDISGVHIIAFLLWQKINAIQNITISLRPSMLLDPLVFQISSAEFWDKPTIMYFS